MTRMIPGLTIASLYLLSRRRSVTAMCSAPITKARYHSYHLV